MKKEGIVVKAAKSIKIKKVREKKLKRKGIVLASILIGVLSSLTILAGSYFGYGVFYKEKFYPGTKISGQDISGLTKNEAKVMLDNHISKQNEKGITIKAEEQNKTYKLEQLGFAFQVEKSIDKVFIETHLNKAMPKWPAIESLFSDQNYPLAYELNSDKLNTVINEMASTFQKDAVNASLNYKNGDFVFAPSVTGWGINKDEAKNTIVKNLENGAFDKPIILTAQKLEPKITKSEQTQKAKQTALAWTKTSISLNFEDKNFSPTASQIAGWIVFAEKNGELSPAISDGQIIGYINSIAKKIDIAPTDKEILQTTGQVIQEGKNGRGINRGQALADIKNALNKNLGGGEQNGAVIALTVEEKPFKEKNVLPDDVPIPGRYPGKYIDIDLSSQLLTLFEGNNLIASYKVSTGKWSMPTPIGERHVVEKTLRAYSAKYHLWMPYWNGIGGGYGVHELPEWGNGVKEGANHLGIPVSHGCVRLGVGPAEHVYNWADIGTPVDIHK